MHILVCNAGSSSLKCSLFEAEGELLLAEGNIDWSSTPTRLVVRCPGQPEAREELTLQHHADAIARILDALQGGPSAVWHSTTAPMMRASRMRISPCQPRPAVSWLSPRVRM